MPITSVSGVSLTNLGPLTTTFTPPPSCLQSNGMMMFAEPTEPLPVGYISCDWDMESCLPSQSKRTTTDTEESPSPYTQVVTYFSPGIVCPADWKTVGTAALPTTGEHFTPEVSGGFKLPAYIGYYDYPPNQLVLANAITHGETAVQCCPSSMTPMRPDGGSCYSALPSYTVSEGCNVYYPDEAWGTFTTKTPEFEGGSTVLSPTTKRWITGTVDQITTVTPIPSTNDYVAYLIAKPLLMVHKASDVTGVPSPTASPTSTSSSSPSPQASSSSTSPASTSNVAARGGLRLVGSHWGDFSALLGFVTAALTVGAVMVVL